MEHHHHDLAKFTCPMHPQIIQDGPGKCPVCGMNLVPVKDSHSENKAATHKNMQHQHGTDNPPMGHEGHDHHVMMIGDFKKTFLPGAGVDYSHHAAIGNDKKAGNL